MIGSSIANQQKNLKKEVVKRHQMQVSGLQQLLLGHFRTTTLESQSRFYSLPRALLDRMPLQDLRQAASTSVARADDNVPSVLPVCDRQLGKHLLALQAGATEGLSDAMIANAPSIVDMEDDADAFVPVEGNIVALPKLQILQGATASASNLPILEWPDGQELLFFRAAHKSIGSLKRPLQGVDDIRPGDMALRFYPVIQVSGSGCKMEVALVEQDNVEVWASSLFTDAGSGVSERLLFDNLLQWESAPRVSILQRFSSQSSVSKH